LSHASAALLQEEYNNPVRLRDAGRAARQTWPTAIITKPLNSTSS